jgi:hypothetical protein
VMTAAPAQPPGLLPPSTSPVTLCPTTALSGKRGGGHGANPPRIGGGGLGRGLADAPRRRPPVARARRLGTLQPSTAPVMLCPTTAPSGKRDGGHAASPPRIGHRDPGINSADAHRRRFARRLSVARCS